MTSPRTPDCPPLARSNGDWVAHDVSRKTKKSAWRQPPTPLAAELLGWQAGISKHDPELTIHCYRLEQRSRLEIHVENWVRSDGFPDSKAWTISAHYESPEEALVGEIFTSLLTPSQLTSVAERLQQLRNRLELPRMAAFTARLERIVQAPRPQIDGVEEFLAEVKRVCEADADAALDIVYEKVDGWMREAKFETLNRAFDKLMPEKLDILIAIGFLVASLPARDRIAGRGPFLEVVRRQALENRTTSEVDELMSGL